MRVIAHEGRQVADTRFLNAHDYREQFSATISEAWDSNQRIGGVHRLKKLYSKWPWGNVTLTVIDDKAGDHLSRADLFDECLRPYHLSMRDLESDGVFNVFLVFRISDDANRKIQYDRPHCKKGDYIHFLAEMDILVAATSCPNDSVVNDYKPKGMKYQMLES